MRAPSLPPSFNMRCDGTLSLFLATPVIPQRHWARFSGPGRDTRPRVRSANQKDGQEEREVRAERLRPRDDIMTNETGRGAYGHLQCDEVQAAHLYTAGDYVRDI